MYCKEYLGDDVTILHGNRISPYIMKFIWEQSKEGGGPLDCYHAVNFFGWEAEKVIVVTDGEYLMEMITRAKMQLRLTPDICYIHKMKFSTYKFRFGRIRHIFLIHFAFFV